MNTANIGIDGITSMPALTVRQPWEWAIFHGKTIENRSQNFHYRGPLAIHAGRALCRRGCSDPRVIESMIEHSPGIRTETADLLRAHGLNDLDVGSAGYGAIIGVVDLHPDNGRCCRPWGESAVPSDGIQGRRIHHLVLDNPVALPVPYPCRGALGLWSTPTDLHTDLPEGLLR